MNDERVPTSYVLVLWNQRGRRVRVGKLGLIRFEEGFYVYVGSGGSNPLRRAQRHLKPTKPRHWHIDYLTTGPRRMRPVDVHLMPGRRECGVAKRLAARLPAVKGFGSSDCRCPGHLFHASGLPLLLEVLAPLLGSPASG